MNPLNLKETLISKIGKDNIDKKFQIKVLSTYLSEILGEWSNVTTFDNCQVKDIPLEIFENSNHVLYIEELNFVFILSEQEKIQKKEKKKEIQALIKLLKENGFKAAQHANPRRDILIKTQEGRIIITKCFCRHLKRNEFLIDYIGDINESFQIRGVFNHKDIITSLNNEFIKR